MAAGTGLENEPVPVKTAVAAAATHGKMSGNNRYRVQGRDRLPGEICRYVCLGKVWGSEGCSGRTFCLADGPALENAGAAAGLIARKVGLRLLGINSPPPVLTSGKTAAVAKCSAAGRQQWMKGCSFNSPHLWVNSGNRPVFGLTIGAKGRVAGAFRRFRDKQPALSAVLWGYNG